MRRAHSLARATRRTALVALLAGLATCLLATTARAQDPPALVLPDTLLVMICKQACDVVSGTVFDSLSDAPLSGAFVVAQPTGVTATTDSLGRFVIASDGRVQQLTAYHGALDELGLGAITATRPRDAVEWKGARIATPSLPTVWRRLCPSTPLVRSRGVIITGSARLTDNTTRLAGAKIMAQWTPPPSDVGGNEPTSTETLTDSTGSFVMCGVADFVEPSLVALAAEAQSSVVTLPADSRPVRRIDIVMAPTGAAPTLVRGRVVNEWNAPLPDVRVSIDGRDGEVITGADGVFRLVGVPLGSRMLSIRRLGFPPALQAVHVVEGEMEPLDVSIRRTYTLGTIKLTSTDTVRRERAEFERRKRTGVGFFIDSTTLQKARDMRTALKAAPGISIIEPTTRASTAPTATDRDRAVSGAPTASQVVFELRGSGACRLNVYLDGVFDPANTPLFTNTSEFAAVEVYARAADVPRDMIVSRRQTAYGSRCGAVYFWTRFGLRP